MESLPLVLQGLELAAWLALPVIAAHLLAGILAGLLQALTGWQDAALSQVPRLLAIGLVLLLAGPWMARSLVDFARLAWAP